MNYTRLVLIGILLLVAGMGLGYYFSPTKTITENKVDDKKETDTTTTETKKYDPNTGKVIEDTKTVENDTKKEHDTDKTKITEREQKHYAVKLGEAINVRNPTTKTLRAGGEVALPFFSSWLGAECDVNTNPTCGAYLRLEF
jgi:hypothetical protein